MASMHQHLSLGSKYSVMKSFEMFYLWKKINFESLCFASGNISSKHDFHTNR